MLMNYFCQYQYFQKQQKDQHVSTTLSMKQHDQKEMKKEHQHRYLAKVKKQKQGAIHYNAQQELLSTHMKYAPSGEQMENAETNIVAALMTLVANTGLGRFPETTTLMDNWQAAANLDPAAPPPSFISNIINEVNQNVTEADMSRIVEEFLQSWNIEAKLFACASCGIKAFEMGKDQSNSISIKELDSLLISDADRDELLNIPLKFR